MSEVTLLPFSMAARSWRLVLVNSSERRSTLFAHSSICGIRKACEQLYCTVLRWCTTHGAPYTHLIHLVKDVGLLVPLACALSQHGSIVVGWLQYANSGAVRGALVSLRQHRDILLYSLCTCPASELQAGCTSSSSVSVIMQSS